MTGVVVLQKPQQHWWYPKQDGMSLKKIRKYYHLDTSSVNLISPRNFYFSMKFKEKTLLPYPPHWFQHFHRLYYNNSFDMTATQPAGSLQENTNKILLEKVR